MTAPRQHHVVPRFYLNGFANGDGRLWALDKMTLKVFSAGSASLAAQHDFYRIELPCDHNDPFVLESSLARLEAISAPILRAWKERIASARVFLSTEEERGVMADYLALQMLRVPEQRIQLHQYQVELAKLNPSFAEAADFPQRALHLALLTDSETVDALADAIYDATWIAARNVSSEPFITSDNPVLVRTADHSAWMKPDAFLRERESYIVFPISPRAILFCYRGDRFAGLRKWDGTVSPVEMDEGMVQLENSGQAGCSYRFLFSSRDDFESSVKFMFEQPFVLNPARNRWRDLPPNPYTRS